MVVFEKPLINSFPLMNQAAINAVWNFLVFNYNLDKVNLISINIISLGNDILVYTKINLKI